MSVRSITAAALVAILSAGCGGAAEPDQAAAPDVPEKCRNVHVDRLAGDWIAVRGSAADPKTRVRIAPGTDGADYEAWFIGGFFQRKRLAGVKRDKDVQFTEIPDDRKKAAVEAGDETLVRVYLQPSLKDCAVKSFVGTVDKAGKEQVPPNGVEFVGFPSQEGVTFAFQPPVERVFLGAAAKDRAVADKQVAELGGPDPAHEMGAVPVGLFTSVESDGDPSCTYDMDVYFDDQRIEELVKTPAGEAKDGWRHWYHEYDAPYSGNHHFELHRFRTCDGGERELIEVAAIEGILQ